MNSPDFLGIAREILYSAEIVSSETAMWCHIKESKITEALSLQYQKGREDGLEEAAKLVEEMFGVKQLVEMGSKSPLTIKQAKDQEAIATAIRNLSTLTRQSEKEK